MAQRRLNVLVLGVGGNVSQGIQKALARAPTPTRVFAACIDPTSAGLYLAERSFISPLAESPDFHPWLFDVIERERIDAVMSGSEIVLGALAEQADSIRERTGAVCIVSPPEVLRTGRDKLLTCRWLEEKGLPAPGHAALSDAQAVETLVNRCGFPLIAKPRLGKGSDGVLIVRDERHLRHLAAAEELSTSDAVRAAATDLLLQEYLGDDEHEFTVGCFCDRDGDVRGTIAMRRTLQAGTTVSAELGAFPDVRESAQQIVAALTPLGPCNVQLRLHRGRAVPFEINPRFSGTTPLRAHFGFNEVDAALRHFVLGEAVPALEDPRSGVAIRYWNEVYVPVGAVRSLERDGRLSSEGAGAGSVERWGFEG